MEAACCATDQSPDGALTSEEVAPRADRFAPRRRRRARLQPHQPRMMAGAGRILRPMLKRTQLMQQPSGGASDEPSQQSAMQNMLVTLICDLALLIACRPLTCCLSQHVPASNAQAHLCLAACNGNPSHRMIEEVHLCRRMLEWPRLCQHVAAFASTTLGRAAVTQLQARCLLAGLIRNSASFRSASHLIQHTALNLLAHS